MMTACLDNVSASESIRGVTQLFSRAFRLAFVLPHTFQFLRYPPASATAPTNIGRNSSHPAHPRAHELSSPGVHYHLDRRHRNTIERASQSSCKQTHRGERGQGRVGTGKQSSSRPQNYTIYPSLQSSVGSCATSSSTSRSGGTERGRGAGGGRCGPAGSRTRCWKADRQSGTASSTSRATRCGGHGARRPWRSGG